MSTRIRLRRMGANKRPFYRVVVADQRSPRDGRFIENIGKYHPLEDPSLIEIDEDRALHWLRVGAQPSDQVRNLMVKIGHLGQVRRRSGPPPPTLVPDRGEKPRDKPKVSKKAAAKAAEAAAAPPAPPAKAAVAPEPAAAEPEPEPAPAEPEPAAVVDETPPAPEPEAAEPEAVEPEAAEAVAEAPDVDASPQE